MSWNIKRRFIVIIGLIRPIGLCRYVLRILSSRIQSKPMIYAAIHPFSRFIGNVSPTGCQARHYYTIKLIVFNLRPPGRHVLWCLTFT
jgi:hypothetical protein